LVPVFFFTACFFLMTVLSFNAFFSPASRLTPQHLIRLPFEIALFFSSPSFVDFALSDFPAWALIFPPLISSASHFPQRSCENPFIPSGPDTPQLD